VDKILDACKQAGLKTPFWEIGEQTVKLTFFNDVKFKGIIEGVTEGASKGTADGSIEGAIEGAVEGVTKGVKEKLTILLSAIAAKEGGRVPDYKWVTGLPDSSVERYIKQLKDGRLIEFRGDAPHTGGYYLTNEMKVKLK
jgi:ATP-dependent DNA helicase RecG